MAFENCPTQVIELTSTAFALIALAIRLPFIMPAFVYVG